MTNPSEHAPAPVPSNLSSLQKRRRFYLASIVFLAAFTSLFCGAIWDGADHGIHEAIEFTGLGLVVVCILGRTWCTLYIGGRKKEELVCMGPYSLFRNPLYVFSISGVVGIGLTTGSLLAGLVLGLLIFLVFDWIVRHEEVYLANAFGAPFAEYCRKTPRWLPRFSAWQDAESVEARPRLMAVTFREALLLLIALPLLEGIEWLQASGFLPVLLRLP
jgi:protein-S-isoprenylcysteine O-methyltransferase Ste14